MCSARINHSELFDYDEIKSSVPERVLFMFVLDRALRDVQGGDRVARREAQQWFLACEHLLPYAIGWQDILDLDYLSAVRIKEIYRILGESLTVRSAA